VACLSRGSLLAVVDVNITVRNPFTGRIALVDKYKLRYKDGREEILYGFIYKKLFIKVSFEMDIVCIDEVIEDYLEALYVGTVKR